MIATFTARNWAASFTARHWGATFGRVTVITPPGTGITWDSLTDAWSTYTSVTWADWT
jgi:hypothetical protein